MRNKMRRKLASVFLALSMTVTYASADAYGSLAGGSDIDISEGTSLSSGVWLSEQDSILQNEKYVTYSPGGSVVPVVAYGSKLYGRSTLDYVADYLGDRDYSVVAGINGDFFNLTTGVSMGVVMAEGQVMASDNGRVAAGFYKDGSVRLGSPGIVTTVNIGPFSYNQVHINKELTASSGLVLYTPAYADTNKAAIANTSVVLRVDSTEMRIGQTITGTVTEVLAEEGEVTIPEGCLVLSTAADSAYATDTTARDLLTLSTGDTVSISLSCAEGWQDVYCAVGSGGWLVYDGSVQAQTDVTKDSIVARTAIGTRTDGSVVLYTTDGSQKGYATGVTLNTLAERMLELGCTYAVNLDGGGSTVMAVNYPGYTDLQTADKPSDGTQRKCANFLFLVNTAEPTGNTSRLFLYPYETWMLTGASQTYEVKATDDNWYPSEVPIVVTFDGGDKGDMDEFGTFTAGTAGTGEVYVKSLGMTGTATVHVVDTPDSITVSKQSGGAVTGTLTVAPGSEVDLTASAVYQYQNLVCSDTSFTWQISGGVGAVDENGLFKAAYTDSDLSGSLTVSCGGALVTVPVLVTPTLAKGRAVEGFENDSSLPQPENPALSTAFETDLTRVRYGRRSLKLSYDFAQAGTETPPSAKMDVALADQPTHLAFWLYGDGQGDRLNVITAKADGTPEIHTVTVDFTGWKYITMALADGTTAIKGIGMTQSSGGGSSGSLWIDQMIGSTGLLSDLTPPEISGTVEGSAYSGTITDNGATKVSSSDITVTVDGTVTPFSFDEATGALSLTLPQRDGSTRRIRITASDACGNLAAASYAVPGSESSPFADMDDHWADSVTTYLYGLGVVSGLTDENGNLVYKPDSDMTREQFAVIMTNYLGTDLTQYASVELPFADKDQISWWALDAVKAAYSIGIIKGDSTGGALNFNPRSSLTRAEAMTIIGRTQPRGYLEAALDGFSDGADVPDWAAAYIRTLIAQDVVSGDNGRILPGNSVTRAQVAKMLCMLV